jgi:hypothetical protein
LAELSTVGLGTRRGVIKRRLRLALVVPLVAFGLGATSAAARVGPVAPLCAQAASSHHVGIVVEHGNGTVVRQCVGFATATITALGVLEASGIEYAAESYGGLGEAVCQIDHEPAQYSSCLPSSGSFWVFFISRGGAAWANSAQGISNATVADGDDVGFRYDPLSGADPAPASPAGTCPTPTPTPSPTASSHPTATPAPSSTTRPGATSDPATLTPGTSSTDPAASVATGAASTGSSAPGSGVLGITSSPATTPAAVAGLSPKGTPGTPLNPGLLVAAVAVAALMALVGVRAVRRPSG